MAAHIDSSEFNYRDAEHTESMRFAPIIRFIPKAEDPKASSRPKKVKIDIDKNEHREITCYTSTNAEKLVQFLRQQDHLITALKYKVTAKGYKSHYKQELNKPKATRDNTLLTDLVTKWRKEWAKAFALLKKCLEASAEPEWSRCVEESEAALQNGLALERGPSEATYKSAHEIYRQTLIQKNGTALQRWYIHHSLKKPTK